MVILKKGDLLIIVLLLFAGLGWLLQDYLRPQGENGSIVIEVDGQLYQRVPLDVNSRYQIDLTGNGYMELVVEDGKAWVSEETVVCPDRICIKTGKISRPGESIVCLPNRVIIYIEGSSQDEIDGISY